MWTPAPVAIDGGGMNLLFNSWLQRSGSGGEFSSRSSGSELDLAVMVSDFVEIGSAGAESWCSSDTDSGLSDLAYLADRISVSSLYFVCLFAGFRCPIRVPLCVMVQY